MPAAFDVPNSTQEQPIGITTTLSCTPKCSYNMISVKVCSGTMNETTSKPLGLIRVSGKKYSREIRTLGDGLRGLSGLRQSRYEVLIR